MNKTIGIIGLGPMGGIIATNLLKKNFAIVVMTLSSSAGANLRPMVAAACRPQPRLPMRPMC